MNDRKPLLQQDLPGDIAALLRAGREDAPPSNGAEDATLDAALRAAQTTSRLGIRTGALLVALATCVFALTFWATVGSRRFGGGAASPSAEPIPTAAAGAPEGARTALSDPGSAEQAVTTEPGVDVLALPDAPPLRASSRDESDDDGLAAIDRARAALASGRSAECLRQLARYRAAYRQHAYEEEAGALEVQALAGLERRDAAEAKARVFFSAYPRSPYAARLRAALGGSR